MNKDAQGRRKVERLNQIGNAGQPLHDYDRYKPAPTRHEDPVPDYERYERRAQRRAETRGAIFWVLIFLLGMILKRMLSP